MVCEVWCLVSHQPHQARVVVWWVEGGTERMVLWCWCLVRPKHNTRGMGSWCEWGGGGSNVTRTRRRRQGLVVVWKRAVMLATESPTPSCRAKAQTPSEEERKRRGPEACAEMLATYKCMLRAREKTPSLLLVPLLICRSVCES